MINKPSGILGTGTVAAGLLCGSLLLFSPLGQAEQLGYAVDSSGQIVHNDFGECVHTSQWTPAIAIKECEPQLVASTEAKPSEVAAMEPAPPQKVMRRINLNSDAYFAFDKAQLTPEGKAKLDELAKTMRSAMEPSITVTGYTDHLGPAQYNLKLSQQRAEAVKAYLVQQGVPSDAIKTLAMGEANPVKSCEGMKGSALIECLGPNRRTDIEFSAFEEVTPEQ